MTTQTEANASPKDAALKLALEALDQLTNAADTFSVSGVYFNEEVGAKKCLSDAYFAINAIQQTLAQQSNEQVEPVAYRYMDITEPDLGFWFDEEPSDLSYLKCEPLYTHPPVPTAQPKEPEQEPVAHRVLRKTMAGEWKHDERYWVDGAPSKELVADVVAQEGLWRIECAYTVPPQRKPMTEQEIWDAVQHGVVGSIGFVSKAVAVARAIEAAHGIKE